MFTLRETPSSIGSCARSDFLHQKKGLVYADGFPAKGRAFTLRRLLFTFDVCVTVYVTKCVDITAVSALDLIEN